MQDNNVLLLQLGVDNLIIHYIQYQLSELLAVYSMLELWAMYFGAWSRCASMVMYLAGPAISGEEPRTYELYSLRTAAAEFLTYWKKHWSLSPFFPGYGNCRAGLYQLG